MFTHYIAEVEHLKLVSRVMEAKFLSIILDGSMDSAVMKQELVYWRRCSGGEIQTHFLTVASADRQFAR